MMNYRTTTLVFSLICSSGVFATSDDIAALTGKSAANPPSIGNFALPSPQQPGPLLSFGQTLIGRNQWQLDYSTFSPYHVVGPFRNMNASMTFGLTDDTSVYFNVPVAADYRARSVHATALKDVTLQLEHAVYTYGNQRYQEQTTVVGAMTLPMEDVNLTKKITGYGSPSYFFGGTYNRTYVDWLFFASPGFWLTTTSDHLKIGSQWLYQAGLGHSICSVTDQSMLFGLLEMDGQYTYHDQVFGMFRLNTGGNVVAFTPSLSLAFRHLITQVGVGFPVIQDLNGNQTKTDYFIAANFIWTIT